MTDKQIIIDGVDVTQCGFFSKVEGKQTNVCYIMPCHELETEKFIGYLGCSTNHNCYYKQLERLKEHHHKTECEASENLKKLVKLEQECEAYKMEAEEGREINAELKAENEELKERLNCNCFDPKSNNNRCISYNRIAEDYERDLKQLDQLKKELEQEGAWHKTSDEISKVNSEYTVKLKQTLAEIKEIVTIALEQNTLINLDKILQKINEVEDDKSNN